MPDEEPGVALWRDLSNEAAAGQLNLDPIVAKSVHDACEAFIEELSRLRQTARNQYVLTGYGDLPSAAALAGKFERKAVGGVDALVTRYEQNIAVVKLIQETVSHSISRIVDEDRDLAGALPSVEGPR
ncbi:hypothetical protein ACHIPZ_16290 [Antrihabitans sp. NCIMB 15449]|uniref:PE domain-containing protein n=1 Tax=Antrihabitans spumae TaxID=3373370 RepID=A0ABW7JRY6_9NOCA